MEHTKPYTPFLILIVHPDLQYYTNLLYTQIYSPYLQRVLLYMRQGTVNCTVLRKSKRVGKEKWTWFTCSISDLINIIYTILAWKVIDINMA